MITLADIEDARKRIGTSLRRTPTVSFAPLRDEIRNHVSLKLENLQVTGSFKPRGALNKILSLSPDARRHGLITASGGNHGLGVAYAGRLLKIPATVFLPKSASAVRRERLLQWGATVIVKGRDWDDAYAAATWQAEHTGQALIHPFNDPMVCAGQGTVALELLEDSAGQLDAVVVPIGGGGLLAGVAACIKQKNPAIQVIGVEPTEAASMTISLQAGRVVELEQVRSIADTLSPRRVGDFTLAAAQQFVDRVVLIEDDVMRRAMRVLWDEYNLLVEPSGAAALGAILEGASGIQAGARVGAIVSGGNWNASASLP